MNAWSVARLFALCLIAGCLESSDLPGPDEVLALHRPLVELAPTLDRDALWDDLSASLYGPLLTRHYVERRVAARRMQAERVRIEVLRVDYEALEIARAGPMSAQVDLRWSVGGQVHHRDHSHLLVHHHAAIFELRALEQGWRIVGEEIRELRDGARPADAFDLLDAEGRGGFLDPLDLIELPDPEVP